VRGAGGNDSITLTENASTTAADLLIVGSVVGTSSESARNTVSGNNNDTGQDSITGFDIGADTIRVITTNVANYVHSTDSVLGTATGDVNDGSVGSFTASTLILNLDKTLGVLGNDAGDIVLSFASTTNAGVAVTTPTIANYQARIQYDLTGTGAADIIGGGALNDTITGGAGADVMTGGGGADSFVFTTASTGLPSATNFDTISDFSKTAGATFDTISATALILSTQTAVAGAGVATITAGVATFNAADTSFAQHLAAVAAAQQATAGATTIWQEGPDAYVFISDGVLAVAATDVLIKLTGVTVGALTVAGNAITAIA
jgi:Ca2+-binding RTX toxin-like protein